MSKKSESPVRCKECGSGKWSKIYSDEQLEGKNDVLQFALAKQVQCDECSYCWELSRVDIIRHFAWLQTEQGKSFDEIQADVTAAKEEGEKAMKERFK